MLRRLRWWSEGIKVWQPSNVYKNARLKQGVSIGKFSEIGPNVLVGQRTRIGMGCFIPEGTTIGKDCFIGPGVCFVHDKLLWDSIPKGKAHWIRTYIHDNVTIGANTLIGPGLTIGRGALIGMGSVITKDVGANEVWFGNPAKFKRMRKEI